MQISKFCDLGYLTFAYPAALIKNGGILFRNTVNTVKMFLDDFRKMILHHKKTLLSLATTSAAACNRLLFARKDVRCGVDGRLRRAPTSSVMLGCSSHRLQCFLNLIRPLLIDSDVTVSTLSQKSSRVLGEK